MNNKILFIFLIAISLSNAAFTQSKSHGSWKDHKTLLYTGAGIYRVFSFTDSKQGETSYVVSGTLTNRLNKYISLNTGLDLYKPENNNGVVVSLNFIPSLGFEKDNILLSVGAGGGLFVVKEGMTLRFMTGFKAGYFFSKKYAASIEIKSPIYYNSAAEFLFSAGVMFVL
jgi:hypothetical protein